METDVRSRIFFPQELMISEVYTGHEGGIIFFGILIYLEDLIRQKVDLFEQLALVLQFNEERHFRSKGQFTAGGQIPFLQKLVLRMWHSG